MRKIKFRAWDKKEKKWYKPVHEAYRGKLHELLVSFGGDLTAHTMTGLDHESLYPDRYILMQYTGLKDKNGVEIYEGDLVRYISDNEASIMTVDFVLQDNLTGYDLTNEDGPEVIGNIYEDSK